MLNNQMVILPSVGYLSHLQRRNFGICDGGLVDSARGWISCGQRQLCRRLRLESEIRNGKTTFGKWGIPWCIGAAHFQSHVYFVENGPCWTVEPGGLHFQLRMMEKSATSLRRWRSPRPGRQLPGIQGIQLRCGCCGCCRLNRRQRKGNKSFEVCWHLSESS